MALSDNSRGIVLMTVAMASFTLNDACMKFVTQTLPLSEAIALRGTFTTIGLLIVARAMAVPVRGVVRTDRRRLLIRTGADVASTLLFLLALRQMPLASINAILQSLPLAVTLGAAVALREPVGWRRMLAISVGFCGVLLIVRPGTEVFDIWSVLALASVGGVVVRDLVTRGFPSAVPSVVIAIWSSAGVALMGYAGLAVEPWVPPTLTEGAILAGASTVLILAYLTVVMAMRVGDVAIIAPFRYSGLIWAILLGWLMFGAFPDALTLTGAGIIVATGLYTYLREHRLQAHIAANRAALIGTAASDR